jgi:hypothetical protein
MPGNHHAQCASDRGPSGVAFGSGIVLFFTMLAMQRQQSRALHHVIRWQAVASVGINALRRKAAP